MALIQLWQNSPDAFADFSIEQILATAGNGKLKDNSNCSKELREFVSQISTNKLAEYIMQTLDQPFDKSGLVLQDMVNELGRRLDYEVQDGLYQGVKGQIGYDGIWKSPENHMIITEVKSTDAYRISLDTINSYREQLMMSGKIKGTSSILIVAGRQDTGELEAQIRGSRYAWDIRMISTEALIKLVRIKEDSDELETASKIRSMLIPMEYTKLDALVDVMFTAVKDAESIKDEEINEIIAEGEKEDAHEISSVHLTIIQSKRDELIKSLSTREAKTLLKKSRALYWDSKHELRAVCSISRSYPDKKDSLYWYSYHPKGDTFLEAGLTSYLLLGCLDLEIAFAIPLNVIRNCLQYFNTTVKSDTASMYWHIKIYDQNNNFYLQLPKNSSDLLLNDFILRLKG
jgi:hypothetical protein